jgi:hypothetical protein
MIADASAEIRRQAELAAAEREARNARRRKIHEIDGFIGELEELLLADIRVVPPMLLERCEQVIISLQGHRQFASRPQVDVIELVDHLYSLHEQLGMGQGYDDADLELAS